jgi:lipid II:glycine glycyltransferase (peptidoglycan interpeptide bridge formation enzyme)
MILKIVTLNIRHEYEFNLKLDTDDLFAAFSATKRKNYRYAEKTGVVTREVVDYEAVELVEYFRNLSMNRRSLPNAKNDKRVSESRQGLYSSGRTRVLVSYIDGEPVGACLFGFFNNRVYGLRGGSSDLGYKKFSMVHLYWTAIKLFKREGYGCLSLGGAKYNEDGLRKFKQMLGTIESPQPSGNKIISEFGARLDMMRRKLKR